jgi:uncharacterized protein (DUF2062 family)
MNQDEDILSETSPNQKSAFGKYKSKIRDFIRKHLLDQSQSKEVKSFSVAVGIFCSIIPLWGLQSIVAVGLSFLLRLNKPITIAVSAISFTPILPVFLYLSYITGSIFFQSEAEFGGLSDINMEFVREHFSQYFIGAWIFALIAGSISGTITYIVLKIVPNKKIKE